MIRQLAQCPYCETCEIALSDSLQLVCNPETSCQPCSHLVWAEGRYSQWERRPLPGRKTKMPHMVGSTEFEWQHPLLAGHEDPAELRAFLQELVAAESDWEFTPPARHLRRSISRDQTVTEDRRVYPDWEVEGVAVFAEDTEAFVVSLMDCIMRQREAWADVDLA